MNCSNIPIEVMEANNPVLFHCVEFIPDSGGAGKYRGGCGIRKNVEITNSVAHITLLGDRHKHRPYGVFEGEGGELASTKLTRDGEVKSLGSKESLTLQRGDIVSFEISGAGGYGNVSERDPTLIEQDIAEGLVTQAGARKSYNYSG